MQSFRSRDTSPLCECSLYRYINDQFVKSKLLKNITRWRLQVWGKNSIGYNFWIIILHVIDFCPKTCNFRQFLALSTTKIFKFFVEAKAGTRNLIHFLLGQPQPIFIYFRLFQTNINFFTTNRYVKKCPSSIRCQDLNSWPLEQESPPITIRPGLLPYWTIFKQKSHTQYWREIFFAVWLRDQICQKIKRLWLFLRVYFGKCFIIMWPISNL